MKDTYRKLKRMHCLLIVILKKKFIRKNQNNTVHIRSHLKLFLYFYIDGL